MKTPLFIEQHFHGCYGVDFNTATKSQIIELACILIKEGIGFIFPTLVTDSIDNINRQISVIKSAACELPENASKILGVHLEGVFLNAEKKGVHDSNLFLKPTIENYKLIEDDFIKIVTLAPELAETNLFEYLHGKGVKIQAGHCIGSNLSCIDGVTHMYNAMSPVTHRGESTALSSLISDNIYCEIIADGVHVSDDALKLLFKAKQSDKIILISDCLPCTRSKLNEICFAGSKVYFDGESAKTQNGTIAGSTKLLPDIVKILDSKNMMDPQFIYNPYTYHNIEPYGFIEFNDNYEIESVNYEK